MILTFLGSGSAFTYGDGNYQSNMLLTDSNGQHLLIDCGSDARFSLGEQGLGAGDISAVYVSHCHADHIGGLEWLGFATYFHSLCSRPRLFIEAHMAELLWEGALRAGMASLEDRRAGLDTFFNVTRLPPQGRFSWDRARLELVPVVHHYNGPDAQPAFGLMIHAGPGGQQALLTTDTQFRPETLAPYYDRADIIFQDCETYPHPSGIHAHYRQLVALPTRWKAKMWLYHYHPGPLPDCRADGFLGFVRKGQRFDLSRPASAAPSERVSDIGQSMS